MKVAFFDRDGTIIEDYPDHKWTDIKNPVFLADSIQTLKRVNQKGNEIIIITNQYLINEGFITVEQYNDITAKMLYELSCHKIEVLDVFHCPHRRNEGCDCIKPEIGMIRKAIMKYPNISIEQSFMVGDSIVDVELAINMEMRGFGIGVETSFDMKNIDVLTNLKDLYSYI
ncbi:HAD-IIIA family hydrolase [Sporosarcina sp. ANT_H38]|uniref:D-glycero-alpha-D-manno-heptose-1,7-bisphosphate 7-phosphatase n=1 Tax=Sporosarcina sp. ANT_H38 TaxID=2597358 RepID=UPI0011F35358|nr:HAD-IIIA family hydrolase [Sporosarcina sp. ANT_H38]KAA0965761.1 HAD-IIIA family hydrolase [Sporosarcina sp. ANT_H38]